LSNGECQICKRQLNRICGSRFPGLERFLVQIDGFD